MNKIALGTVQFGLNYGVNNSSGQVEEEEVYKILDLAHKSGIDTLDTAHAYGNSEVVLGKYFEEKPKSFKLVSKIPDIDQVDASKMFNESAANLKTDTMYGYLFHNYAIYEKKPKVYAQLLDLKKRGKVKKIGFSLYYPEELLKILDKNLEIDLVQVPYSLFDQRFEPYFDSLNKKRVEIHVRSVFLQGLVFKKPAELNNFFSPIRSKLEKLNIISLESGVPISALCLNFAVLNNKIDKVVIGVDNIANLRENLKDLQLKARVNEHYDRLKALKEDDKNMILPINWKLV